MAKEGAVSVVEEIRKALRESAEGGKGGAGMPDELFWVPQDGIKVVRILSPLTNEGIVKVVMHDRFGKNNTGMMPQPCFRYYGKKCPFCDAPKPYRTSEQYAVTVYDYEAEAKKIFLIKGTLNSCMEDLLEILDANGTVNDRDIKIMRRGKGKKTHYKAREVQKEATEFEGKFKVPYSRDKIFAIMKGMITQVKVQAAAAEEEEEESASGDGDEE